VSLCVCVCVYVCVRARVCVCVCVCVCLSVYMRHLQKYLKDFDTVWRWGICIKFLVTNLILVYISHTKLEWTVIDLTLG
jgi:hypothetical protein